MDTDGTDTVPVIQPPAAAPAAPFSRQVTTSEPDSEASRPSSTYRPVRSDAHRTYPYPYPYERTHGYGESKDVDLKVENFYVESATDSPESAFTLSNPNSYAYYQQDRGTFFIKKKAAWR